MLGARSSMDRIRVSEALDTGSIPVGRAKRAIERQDIHEYPPRMDYFGAFNASLKRATYSSNVTPVSASSARWAASESSLS